MLYYICNIVYGTQMCDPTKEAGMVSDNGFERLSSAELVEADYDEPKKMVWLSYSYLCPSHPLYF